MAANYDTEKKYGRAQRAANKRAKARSVAGRKASSEMQSEIAGARKRSKTRAYATPASKEFMSRPSKTAKKAAPKAAPKTRAEAGLQPTRAVMGVKKGGNPYTEQIRATEWAYKRAQRKKNLRDKARTKAGVAARKSIAADKRAGGKVGKYGK